MSALEVLEGASVVTANRKLVVMWLQLMELCRGHQAGMCLQSDLAVLLRTEAWKPWSGFPGDEPSVRCWFKQAASVAEVTI